METKLTNALLIAVIVLLIAGGVWMFFQQAQIKNLKKSQMNSNSGNQLQEVGGGDSENISGIFPSKQKNSEQKSVEAAISRNVVNGLIKEIKGNTIILSVVLPGNKTVEYTINVSQDAFISKMVFSDPPQKTFISLNDLKEGDKIVAFSKDPLNGKTQFEAIGVELLLD